MPVTYFALWMTRLLGWLPDLSCCRLCGERLTGPSVYFDVSFDGLFCGGHEPGSSPLSRRIALTADSQELVSRIFHVPVSALAKEPWPRGRAADLRRFAIESLERHLERKLTTAAVLARMGAPRALARR